MSVAVPDPTDPRDLARRWREAVEAGDMEGFAALYVRDATVWTNLEGVSHPVDKHLERVATARASATSWRYTDVQCQRTDNGFVSEHTVRVLTPAGDFVTNAAIVATVVDERILHLAEYLTKPRRA